MGVQVGQGFRGVLGTRNAPLQSFAVMVQRDAAGSLRVSLSSLFLIPQEWGPATVLSVKVFGVFR